MRDLYKMIVNELYKKSISALLYLLESGRELSFKYNNTEYAITWKNETIYLDSENHDELQSYESTWEFVESAVILGKPFLEVWDKIELLYLL